MRQEFWKVLHICLCARACLPTCARKRVCACVCVCVCGAGSSGASTCAYAWLHVVFLIQHATRMRHIVTSFVASLAAPHFSTLSHKRHDFRKKVIEHRMCVFIFSTTFIWNVSHSKNNSAECCHQCEKSSCKDPSFSSHFNEIWIFATYFRKSKYKIYSKCVQWESRRSIRKHRRTDRQALQRW